MIMTNKILAVALITALIGASLGAAVMHSRDTAQTAETSTTAPDATTAWNNGTNVREAKYAPASEQRVPAEFNTTEQQSAYKVGFADGFQACGENRNVRVASAGLMPRSGNSGNVVYRSAPRAYRSNASVRRVYYDYNRPKGRSFWNKHRDKLTMA